MSIRRKAKKQKPREIEVDVGGKKHTLRFSSDIDQILSGLGIALLSLGDPKVDAILGQFGLVFHDVDGEPIGKQNEN